MKMGSTQDRGIRVAIDVRDQADPFDEQPAGLTLYSEEVPSQTALEILEVERWKMM